MKLLNTIMGLLSGTKGTPAIPGDGTVSDLAGSVKRAIEREAPELNVIIQDPLSLKVVGESGESTLDLGNLRAECASDPPGCATQIDTFAKMVADVSKTAFAKPGSEEIRALLKDEVFMRGLAQKLAEGPKETATDNAVVSKKFLADLWIVYVVDSPASISMLTQRNLRDMGLDADQVHALALANMSKALTPFKGQALENIPGLHGVDLGDSYEAARLLLVDAWKPMAEEVPGDLIACAPIRNAVLYAGSGDDKALADMGLVAKDLMQQQAYALSTTQLRWTPEGWKVHVP